MKLINALAVTAIMLSSSSIYAADGVQKEIKIVANINDAIFVSKPDGSTWYDKEELYAKDYTQTSFASDDLPVRVYTTDNEVNVSLVRPLTVARADGVQLADVAINFANKAVSQGTPVKLTQTATAPGGYDNTYTLKITAKAPTASSTSESTNGQYQGDLVLLFEPKA